MSIVESVRQQSAESVKSSSLSLVASQTHSGQPTSDPSSGWVNNKSE